MTATVSEIASDDFVEQVKVSAVFIECQGKYLYMRKVAPEVVAGQWGVVGGKVEEGESVEEAAVRELKEEAGIDVCSHAIKYLKPLYIQTSYSSFGFYIHVLSLKEMPEVVLSDEHDEFRWVPEDEVENLDIMAGGIEPFRHAQKYFKCLKKPKALISAYLILRKEDKVCLGVRKNTGYMDGYYGLISGHVEAGESASLGMVREAKEEAGIHIDPDALECVHIMHRTSSDRLNIDVFFECKEYQGEIVNNEPDKCAGWEFFDFHELPSNTKDYVRQAIEQYTTGNPYSEWGFTKVSS